MEAKCPNDWVHRPGTEDCYLFHSEQPWTQANTFCQRYNAGLLSIVDPDTKVLHFIFFIKVDSHYKDHLL